MTSGDFVKDARLVEEMVNVEEGGKVVPSSLESGSSSVEMGRSFDHFEQDHHDTLVYSLWPRLVLKSVCTVLLRARIKVLLPFGPLAIFINYYTADPGWVFFLSLLGITPLAERLGYATDNPSCMATTNYSDAGRLRTTRDRQSGQITYVFLISSVVGGLLNATFGNATEMIVSIYALKSGMVRVVQQSLLGSILSNLLMVLGCAFFIGGIVHREKKVQVFNKAAAVVDSGLLLVAVMGIMIPGVLHSTNTEVQLGKSELSLSRFSSCTMLLAYATYLFFQLKSHSYLYNPVHQEDVPDEEGQCILEEEVPEITQWEAISWLAILTFWVSVLSGYLVDAIQGASESLHLPMGFINVILIPIAGNSAAYATTIMFAIKDKLDITLGVAIGSSTQIAMFAIPFYVVVGWIVNQPMDLNFHLFETATLLITVVIVAYTLQCARRRWFLLAGSYLEFPSENDSNLLIEQSRVEMATRRSYEQFEGDDRLRRHDDGFAGGGWYWPRYVWKSVCTVLLGGRIKILMPFGPLAIFVSYYTGDPGWVFCLSLLGIIPLAERLGYATEQIAYYTGPTGMAKTETCINIIISLCVRKVVNPLSDHQPDQTNWIASWSVEPVWLTSFAFSGSWRSVKCNVWKCNRNDRINFRAEERNDKRNPTVFGSLLGSILSNLLMVLGCAFFIGGIVHREKKVQVFNKVKSHHLLVLHFQFLDRSTSLLMNGSLVNTQAAAIMDSAVLLVGVMVITTVQLVALSTDDVEVQLSKLELPLSRFSSCLMLIVYAAYLFFQLKSHHSLYNPNLQNQEEVPDEESNRHMEEDDFPETSQWEAISWLAILTGASESLHFPTSFINVILVPIAGNSAAYATTIMFAIKDKLDISLAVAIGSSTQIAMFAIPFYVVVGWIVKQPMDLDFQLFETATLFISMLITAYSLQVLYTVHHSCLLPSQVITFM
ncbi:unnamed protein product [Linum tenue]|uniref:Sodium/calcium exchanger membrane region domain-containing protein n=1 Tax=Linum tenue TaxID=586396 RepID=A0AAV0JPF9_9ROSI|nr:unnamed protein product [Linum tenue]